MAKFYNVCVPTTGKDRDGNEKTYWKQIGRLIPKREGDGFTLALFALPIQAQQDGQVYCQCMPPKDESQPSSQAEPKTGYGQYGAR